MPGTCRGGFEAGVKGEMEPDSAVSDWGPGSPGARRGQMAPRGTRTPSCLASAGGCGRGGRGACTTGLGPCPQRGATSVAALALGAAGGGGGWTRSAAKALRDVTEAMAERGFPAKTGTGWSRPSSLLEPLAPPLVRAVCCCSSPRPSRAFRIHGPAPPRRSLPRGSAPFAPAVACGVYRWLPYNQWVRVYRHGELGMPSVRELWLYNVSPLKQDRAGLTWEM